MKILITIVVFAAVLHSQSVYEPVNSDIYNFFKTLSVKGIVTFDYEIKPLLRIEIAKKLLDADKHAIRMTEIEKDLLAFYIRDFKHEINLIENDFKSDIKPEFIITEKDRRIRLFEYAGKDFSFFADPLLSLSEQSIAGENLFVRRNGFSFYGYALDNWAYSLNFFDNEESGNNLDITKDLTPERGTSITKIKENAFEYDQVNASVGYYWNNGSISLGKEYFNIGSGIIGNVILNDKAPSFPFIRLDYKPVDWLNFFYFHGFLISNVPDSSTFRYSQVDERSSMSDVPKFMAFHTLTFYPTDNFSFTLGESIVYSEYIQPIYLIPVMFFRIADHYLSRDNGSASGNAQIFADASYTNPSIRSKFYGSLFIDELSFNSIFEGGNLSALGYTLGIESADLLFNNSTIGIEYTRVNPFVYMNSVDAQTFTNDSYNLGHWIGSNGDIISFIYKQYLMRSLKLSLSTWYFRKGKKELPDEQYTTPYPEFLYGEKRYEYGMDVRLKFRPWHPVSAEAFYSFIRITDELDGRTLDYKLSDNHYFGVTISYGF
jgi:hypothetical protein